MHPILNRNLYFVKEHVKVFKAANSFDIFDPDTRQIILSAREENLGFFTKMFRFTDYKRMTPFEIDIKTPEGINRAQRGFFFSFNGRGTG
jgi:hypothetical protein